MTIEKEAIVTALQRSNPRKYGTLEFPGFARAAVLVPLIPTADGLSFLLTQRTEHVETHKGQISFPGGVQDHPDETPVQTALRETHEELGIDPHHIEILGTLNEKPVPSKFIICPIVGYLQSLPPLSIHDAEVADIFTAPLSFFADDANARTEHREFHGRQFTVWHYQFQKYHVWGATAGIIRDLIDLIHPS